MNKHNVRKILKNSKEIKLPGCTYCRTICCWECAYFETHSPDSKGQCRCDHYGEWHYPHEGCTNGITRKEKLEIDAKEIRRNQVLQQPPYSPPESTPPSRNTTPSYSSNNNHTSKKKETGEGAGPAILFAILLIGGLVSRIESCAADAGILQSDVTFQLNAPSTAAESNVPDALTLVHSDGARRVYTIEFGDTHETAQTIRKGDYEEYLLKDRMAFSSVSHYFNGVDDYSSTISEVPAEDDLLNTLILTVRVKGGQSLPAEGLTVVNQAGDILPCTPYGENGTYIVLLFDKDLSDPQETLTVSAPGYRSAEIKVDFRNKRICEKSVKLSGE